MNRPVLRCLTVLSVMGLACLRPSHPAVGAEPQSIADFLRLEARWRQLADAKVTVTVEGRYSSISPSLLRFHKCDLGFQPARGLRFVRPSQPDKTIEVSGHLEMQDGRLVFLAEQYHVRPSDSETMSSRRNLLDRNKPQAWYELAAWASARAKFYGDDELAKAAQEAYRSGIDTERQKLSGDDPAALEKLAVKAAEFKLPESLRLEFVHEAYRLRWKAARNGTQKQLQELAGRMVRDLPGCQIPLHSPDAELQKKYRADPLAVYRETDAEGRRKLHRLLYSEVVQALIEKDAAADGSNGFQIAEQIDKQLPEQHALAESYRDRELAFRLSKVATMTKQEMLELAGQFETRKRPEKFREAKEKWFQARLEQYRREGAPGLLRAAELCVEIFNDEKREIELLKKSHKLNPDSKEAVDRLKNHGLQLHKGKWLTEEQMAKLPVDEMQQKVYMGIVVPGMTREQVRKAWTAPKSKARIATTRYIIEVWIYQDTGKAVSFQRRRRAGADDFKVIGVASLGER